MYLFTFYIIFIIYSCNVQEQREKTLETEIGKLKDQITAKDKQLSDLSDQMGKMNEDLFSNLVSIEELKTVIHEKSSKITICENEISNLKKELFEKSQQVVSIRSNLSDSDKEKKRLESKIESLLNELKESNAIKKKEIEVKAKFRMFIFEFNSYFNVVMLIFRRIKLIRKNYSNNLKALLEMSSKKTWETRRTKPRTSNP